MPYLPQKPPLRKMPANDKLPSPGWAVTRRSAPPKFCSWDHTELVVWHGLVMCPECDKSAMGLGGPFDWDGDDG